MTVITALGRWLINKRGLSPAPGLTHIIFKNVQIKKLLIPSCVGEGYQWFPSKLFKYCKSLFILRQPLFSVSLQEFIYDLSQGLICKSGSSPQSSDKCPLGKRCLDKNSTASTSSEVFNEVYTQSMSLLLGQEPFVGFLVVVVWLDVVGANLVPVQYQT